MYTKLIGAIIIVTCTTMFGIDRIKSNKQNADNKYAFCMFFEKLSDTFAAEMTDIATAMEKCCSVSGFPLNDVVLEFCTYIRSGDTTSVKDAWIQCKENHNVQHINQSDIEVMDNFVDSINSNSADSCINAAKTACHMLKSQHSELCVKAKGDNRLMLNMGVCAGIFMVVLLM